MLLALCVCGVLYDVVVVGVLWGFALCCCCWFVCGLHDVVVDLLRQQVPPPLADLYSPTRHTFPFAGREPDGPFLRPGDS